MPRMRRSCENPGSKNGFVVQTSEVRSEPGCRLVWQNADDRMRHILERDAATDDVRIAAEPFAPEILGDQGDIGALLFVRQEISPSNRADAEHVEIIRRYATAVELHRIAYAGQFKAAPLSAAMPEKTHSARRGNA